MPAAAAEAELEPARPFTDFNRPGQGVLSAEICDYMSVKYRIVHGTGAGYFMSEQQQSFCEFSARLLMLKAVSLLLRRRLSLLAISCYDCVRRWERNSPHQINFHRRTSLLATTTTSSTMAQVAAEARHASTIDMLPKPNGCPVPQMRSINMRTPQVRALRPARI